MRGGATPLINGEAPTFNNLEVIVKNDEGEEFILKIRRGRRRGGGSRVVVQGNHVILLEKGAMVGN